MSTNLHVMGNRIRTARQFRKLTAEQLSEQLGIATESLRISKMVPDDPVTLC